MLMARNVFSSSFTISALWVDDTGTTVSKIVSKTRRARSVHRCVSPPTTFGTSRTRKLWLAGSMRSGAKATAMSSPTCRPLDSSIGTKSSWVVPGYVVLPTTTSWPLRARLVISSRARAMWETSGSFDLVSGVGTQTLITSQRESRLKSVVADRCPASTARAMASSGTSSM